MHNTHLIINARSHLPWQTKVLSDSLTAIMWGAWLFLWRPVVHVVIVLHAIGCTDVHKISSMLHSCTPDINFENGLLALLSSVTALLLWSLLPSKKVKTAHRVNSLRDYAQYFQLNDQQINQGRHKQIAVVYHNEQGQIIGIK
ncbi:MAG: poly-beta-1,6-N-acetyl-D-glucosamine biosynthesis protein PgaD [Agitococcus sp.]